MPTLHDPLKPQANKLADQAQPKVHDPFKSGYRLPEPKPRHEAADYGKLLGAGAGQFATGIGYVADKATGGALNRFTEEKVGRSLTDIGTDVSEFYRSRLSPAMQESMHKRFISDQPGEVFGSAWSDPHAIAGNVVQSLPITLPGMGAAGAAGSVAGRAAARQALSRGATQAAVRQAARKAGGRAAMVAGGLSEGGISGGLVGADVESEVLRAPQEALDTSPYYQQLLSQGHPPQEARALTAKAAGESAALPAGALTGVLGSYFNRYIGDLMAGGRQAGRLASAGHGAAAEAATEFAQSGQESYHTQQAARDFAGGSEVNWRDILNEAVAGSVAGGVMGAGFGALAPGKRPMPNVPPAPTQDASAPPLGLPSPGQVGDGRWVVFPDGTAARRGEVEQAIANLEAQGTPEAAAQAMALRAQLLGMGAQPAGPVPPTPQLPGPEAPPLLEHRGDLVVFPNGTVAEPGRVEQLITYLRRQGRSAEARRILDHLRQAQPVAPPTPRVPVEERAPGIPHLTPQQGEPLAVSPEGEAFRRPQSAEEQAAARELTPEQAEHLGLTPDIRRAQRREPRQERTDAQALPATEPVATAQEETAAVEPPTAPQAPAAEPADVSTAPAEEITQAAQEAATSPENNLPEPTEAQKEAGNYKKGHVRLHGLDISIENPQGSTRSGTDPEGNRWEQTLAHHYGYFKGSEARDGDQVDVFLGPQAEDESLPVFVVDQVDPRTGRFDEPKVMLGFASEQDAMEGYLANYEPGWRGLGDITPMSLDQFKEWVQSPEAKKPAAEYRPPHTTPIVDTETPADDTQTPVAETPELTVEDLSAKSVIIKGNTREHKDRIKALRGLWNRKNQGWIFPKAREAQVREALVDLLAVPQTVPETPTPEKSPELTGLPAGLKKGDRVRISDGTPEPPARNTRQHARWKFRNYDAFFHRMDGHRPLVDRSGQGMVVESVDLDTVAIEKIDEAPEPATPRSPEAPRATAPSQDLKHPWPHRTAPTVEDRGLKDRVTLGRKKQRFWMSIHDSDKGKVFELAEGYPVTFPHSVVPEVTFFLGGFANEMGGKSFTVTEPQTGERINIGSNPGDVLSRADFTLSNQIRREDYEKALANRDKAPALPEAQRLEPQKPKEAPERATPTPQDPGVMNLLDARNALIEVRARIAEQGRAVNDRLLEKERQLERAVRELEQAAPPPQAEPEARPADYGKKNKIFTEDAAAKARELLRKKLGQLHAGIDPEIMQAGITLAGYHIEAGMRKFSDYANAMVSDLGEGIRPYLKSFYTAVRAWPGLTTYQFLMTS
jgi:hypothetical protein